MKHAYNSLWLHNLHIVKEAKQWLVSSLITKEQYKAIADQHLAKFYHPNIIIRILLLLATGMVVWAITGLLGLMFLKAFEDAWQALSILYGIGWLVVLDRVIIAAKNHYKSGISESILYHALLFIMLGFAELADSSLVPFIIVLTCLLIFSAYRYLDLISTAGALTAFAWLVFYLLNEAGGTVRQTIPLVFMVLFTPLYFFFKRLRQKDVSTPWDNCLVVLEAGCLLLIYAAGNYFVVREMSIALMNLDLPAGQDIPLAFVFYGLTVLIPILYLYFGLKSKDLVLMRVSLAVLACSVFTFKYYFSLGHHEITLTVSGSIVLGISIALLRWLKTPKRGFTRENILTEKWANSNAQAFVVAQTLGVAKPPEVNSFGGGQAGGGGAESKF